MDYILSENMSSPEHMRILSELSNMTDDPSDSNPYCFRDLTIQESMFHILSFEILKKTKGLFVVWPLGGIFLAFRLI